MEKEHYNIVYISISICYNILKFICNVADLKKKKFKWKN